jgi:hypothetical protein
VDLKIEARVLSVCQNQERERLKCQILENTLIHVQLTLMYTCMLGLQKGFETNHLTGLIDNLSSPGYPPNFNSGFLFDILYKLSRGNLTPSFCLFLSFLSSPPSSFLPSAIFFVVTF